jgi:AmmeMemoRadiSam system protein A
MSTHAPSNARVHTTPDHGAALVRFARERLREALGGPLAERPRGAWTTEPAASFVSFHWPDGELQGCIGSLAPSRPLVDDVAYNAIAAGTRDLRGRDLHLDDVDDLEVEVSILSPLEPMAFRTEEEAKRAVRPGVDGLLLEVGDRRGTFLPVVWESLPEVDDFFAALKRKAGLSPRFWSDDVRLHRYTVELFREPPRRRLS